LREIHPSACQSPQRRALLRTLGGAVFASSLAPFAASVAWAAAPAGARYRNLVVLIELKGGNDGLNTVAPYADPAYYALRPKLALARDALVRLSDRAALHPALAPLLPLWEAKELAIVEGVGYPAPNLSHFRSIEIWDTASASDQYLQDGWLARAFAAAPPPRAFAADGVVIGSNDLGPLAGGRSRVVVLNNTEAFLRQAKLAVAERGAANPALAHIANVEADIIQAAARLDARHRFATAFPSNAFGAAVRTACQVIANPSGAAVVRISQNGYDTHGNQAATQARLLGELAQGIVALRAALVELERWDTTLVLTYAEFGRRPRENASLGTDHGTANVHFALGGRVGGGFHGAPPVLDRLGGDGNPAFAVDFRSVYATLLERWWGVPAAPVLGGRFTPIDFLKT
jgi:uncharacterized protein (DUF1501 family)